MPPPQLVVLDAVRGHRVLPTEVDEEDGRPQDLQVAVAVAGAVAALVGQLIVPVEEGGEGVDRQRVGGEVRQPHARSERERWAPAAHPAGDKQQELQQEAAQDEDAQLPLLPPAQ